ncbi:tetratricopeptide repeat protein [Pseudodesulfovibrio sp.]|uniref:tetratricopeptide repeat protein n=1 Tax=Pseudodesulfovibrio sp. TaxID=2035812 RepID=UPI002631677E|nr:tetratricopeptide repeat protein [Pseudodesulfovibrio sp.]MDD3312577.1 tetratricopeptide repeat protein [Pseudodesulfovibrio sp.]
MGNDQPRRGQEEAGGGLVKRSTCIILVVMALLVGAFVGNTVTMLYVGQRQGAAPAPTAASAPAGGDVATLSRLEQETAAHPTDANAWVDLGNYCFDNGLFEKAVAAYEHALELSPMRADVWSDLGVMYRRTSRFNKAIEAFGQAAKIDPAHTTSRYNMGVVYYFDLNDKANALKIWKGLLADDPQARTPDGRPLADLIRETEK